MSGRRKNCWCVEEGETVGVWKKEKLLVVEEGKTVGVWKKVCGKRTGMAKGGTVSVETKGTLGVWKQVCEKGETVGMWEQEKLLVCGKKMNYWCVENVGTVDVRKKEELLMCGKRRNC